MKATKAGMQGLTRQLAVDYASSGIRFNTVSPGGIETQLNRNSAKAVPCVRYQIIDCFGMGDDGLIPDEHGLRSPYIS
jgi:NAD(P)-dependent dehydrogenase (short-subunit alcohol dehydrogenase family)